MNTWSVSATVIYEFVRLFVHIIIGILIYSFMKLVTSLFWVLGGFGENHLKKEERKYLLILNYKNRQHMGCLFPVFSWNVFLSECLLCERSQDISVLNLALCIDIRKNTGDFSLWCPFSHKLRIIFLFRRLNMLYRITSKLSKCAIFISAIDVTF